MSNRIKDGFLRNRHLGTEQDFTSLGLDLELNYQEFEIGVSAIRLLPSLSLPSRNFRENICFPSSLIH